MNELLAQLRLEREARRGADAPAPQEGNLQREVEAPQPEPRPRTYRPEAVQDEASAHAAEVQREQRLQHLRSRRRSRRASAGRHAAADPPAPSLAGTLGLADGVGLLYTRAPTGQAARRTPTPEELGFAPTLEATLSSSRPVRTGKGDGGQHALDREQRRPVRRPRPTAAELGFCGDLAAVLGSARPRWQLMPEPEPEPEPELGPRLNEPWRDAVPDRPSRVPSAASLGFHSESLETVLQPVRVTDEHSDAAVSDISQDAAAVGSSIHRDPSRLERPAADGGVRSMPDLATSPHVVDQHAGRRSASDDPNLAEPEQIDADDLQTPPTSSTAVRGVPAWSHANADDLQEESGGFYTGTGSVGIADQDRTPFRLAGAGATRRGSHGGMGSDQQREDASVASVVGAHSEDPFLQAIEAASRPAERPQQQQRPHLQQQERRRPSPASSADAVSQDDTPFLMGAARGGGDTGRPVRPEEHAADWEALGRRSGAEAGVNLEDRSGLERYRDASLAGRGLVDGRGGATAQAPHPEWVMPRRQPPAPRPQPGRRRSSRANERARAAETSQAARVALASLLESSGEWTYEQLIALDDENVSRAGLRYATVRTFERRRCTDEEKADGEACAICLEPYCDEDWLKRLPCEHCFHEDCILHWFKDHTLCPMCRFDCQCEGHGQ